MKSIIYLTSAYLLLLQTQGSYPFEVDEYPCPPYHEETSGPLEKFLTHDGFSEQREKLGIDRTILDEISYLKAHEGCSPSEPQSPKSSDFLTTYYKSNEFYFSVNYYTLPAVEKVGENVYNFNLVDNSLIVYDSNFEVLIVLLL
jgi:hypothetical protein